MEDPRNVEAKVETNGDTLETCRMRVKNTGGTSEERQKKLQKALKPLVQTLTVKEQGKSSRFKQKKTA